MADIVGIRNFATEPHKTLRCTPAMAAGLTDRLWEMKDIVALIEDAEAAVASKVRGPYKPRAPKLAQISN